MKWRHCRSRGQTKLESLVALVLLALAFLGAWMLYGPQISHTTGQMLGAFQEPEPESPQNTRQIEE